MVAAQRSSKKNALGSQNTSSRNLYGRAQGAVNESKFKSKLPEMVQSYDELEAAAQKFDGKFQVRVFDGDFCQTRDEALSKFRERQIK